MKKMQIVTVSQGTVLGGTDRVITTQDRKDRTVLALDLGAGNTFGMHRSRPPVMDDDSRLYFAGMLSFVVDKDTADEHTRRLLIATKEDAPLASATLVLVEDADLKRIDGDVDVLETGDHALVLMGANAAAIFKPRSGENEFLVLSNSAGIVSHEGAATPVS